MNSTFFWMNENSIGVLKNIILEVDFNIYDKKIQIVDVSGNFKCEDVKIYIWRVCLKLQGLMLMLLFRTLKFLLILVAVIHVI